MSPAANVYTKVKWYRYKIAKRIRNLEGEELISELKEIIEDIKEKKLDKVGLFELQIKELEDIIKETKDKPKQRAREHDPFYIPPSGDGRIALFGLSNVGKSSLMNAITNAEVIVGDFLNTTRQAQAGTCEYKNLKIQIIDLPGFLDFKEDWMINKQIIRVARTSDAILMVIDLTMDIESQYTFLMKQLETAKIMIDGETSYKIGIIATKGDLPSSKQNYEILKEITNLKIIAISINNELSLEKLKEELFEHLEVIRIYTKPPKEKPNLEKPFVCSKGSTIENLAKDIHTSFPKLFRYARVWGKSCEFQGQRVGLEHALNDEDIVELNLKR